MANAVRAMSIRDIWNLCTRKWLGTRTKGVNARHMFKGEALEVFKTLNVDERKDYQIIKDTLKAAFRAEDFKYTALNEYILEQCFRMRHLNSICLSLKD